MRREIHKWAASIEGLLFCVSLRRMCLINGRRQDKSCHQKQHFYAPHHHDHRRARASVIRMMVMPHEHNSVPLFLPAHHQPTDDLSLSSGPVLVEIQGRGSKSRSQSIILYLVRAVISGLLIYDCLPFRQKHHGGLHDDCFYLQLIFLWLHHSFCCPFVLNAIDTFVSISISDFNDGRRGHFNIFHLLFLYAFCFHSELMLMMMMHCETEGD